MASSDKDLKGINEELNKKVDEATELHGRRDSVAAEGRKKQRAIREITLKVKDVSRNINDLEGQKKDLERARDECIMA